MLLSAGTMGSFIVVKIWETLNRPMTAGIMVMPPIKKWLPKVNRAWPCMGSMPMQATTRPTQPIIRPFSTSLVDRDAMMVRPNRAIMNFSWGPNWKANLARGGARKMRASTLTMPPQKEATDASTSAAWDLPLAVMA